MRIGALLGRNQSFQAVGSWSHPTAQSSVYFNVTSGVHSSGGALGVQTFSSGGAVDALRYPLGTEFARYACPNVNTHDMDLLAWARADAAVDSGQVRFGMAGSFQAIAYATAPIAYRMRLSGITAALSLQVAPAVAHANSFTAYLDDLLPLLDPIDLHPEWEGTFQQHAARDFALGRDGGAVAFPYGHWFAQPLPLRFVSTSHAEIVNHWWQMQAPLALTVSSANAEGTYLCRIANVTQPFAERIRPNLGLWVGMIQLEGLAAGGGLEF